MPRLLVAFTLVTVTTAGQARSADAQWPPDSLVNLQVLPEDITVRELVGVMRGFAGGLGVRCTFCHVGENSNDLASIDFPSDDKIEKNKAREMLRMVQRINTELLAEVPERSDPPVEVRCATCHHGVTTPLDIRDILIEKVRTENAEAAISEYQTLRDEYYGSYSYDFRHFMLANVAERIGREHPQAALRLLEFNAELYPESAQTFLTMAQVHRAMGTQDGAIQALERAIEIEPENEFYKQALERLRNER